MRTGLASLAGAFLFVFSWVYRFNDPGGSYNGLTDDHFFYIVRGWQILFGDLPVRDFVDHGAPLHYYVAAGVQAAFGRGTLSELVFSVTVLSLCTVLTFAIAVRASGSMLAAACGAVVLVALEPRFYNYPKLLVYAAAIPLLWLFADRQTARTLLWLAVATVVGFLFRHDHGVFVALAFAAMLGLLTHLPWRARVRHAAVYGALVMALLLPYLVFLQVNGGIVSYFAQASAWAARDRDRSPVAWPGLFDNPEGVSPAARDGRGLERVMAVFHDNAVAWIYYLEIALPLVALLLIVVSRDGWRPTWPRAPAKLAVVAVLALLLDAGFLRAPLEARVADPAVPHAVLLAWMLASLPRMLRPSSLRRAGAPRAARLGAAALTAAVVALLIAAPTRDVSRRLEKASLVHGVDRARQRVSEVVASVRRTWPLRRWAAPNQSPSIALAYYLTDCTAPTDRVFVQPYLPQVVALARRAFAGGHADLRPGFFESESAQRLTVERLRRQRVPVVLLSDGNFGAKFPLVMRYFDEHFIVAGTRSLGSLRLRLLVARGLTPRGRFAPLDWPCF